MTESHPPADRADSGTDWAEAFSVHRRWLRTVLFARLPDATAVEEVMQEVALAVARQDAAGADGENVAAWLYRVAVRQALLYRRRAGRRIRRLNEYAARAAPTNGRAECSPLAWLLADEQTALVRRALDRLSDRDRELLLLKYTEDWSCRELAERLGVPVTTIETRLQRARGRLRRELVRLQVIEDES